MKNLAKSINSFKNSKLPEYRQLYLNSINEIINSGERLVQLSGDKETEINVQKLKKIRDEYKIYPQITID
jgi:hypothetical protein